ncbi:ThiF family adenylyltransferase [Flavobacterium sp. ZT3R18]|uniref:ThiF family adenylyltransferase n=1 Tax=Flavobacterium sp. ZT3R18 TaxID=2594429 RepID=UPI00117B484B|nr:ThiF family adenylyltransferase [Flavobacterium sp. ZT3R18]TRX31188.1 ThiF family adenylyltransferase [Flavobacterium sp. ZT3R18]
MEDRYTRNRLYLTEEEQEIIKNFPILLAGSGIGSVIAECALRFGFEKITIVDGDQVERSNLNRQNYTEDDVDSNKVDALARRLKSINKNAEINCLDFFLTVENVGDHIKGHKAAINALDFSSPVPLIFDTACQKLDIPILHPYNIGWGSLVTVIAKDGLLLNAIANDDEVFNEVTLVEYASSYMRFWGSPQNWIDDIVEKYRNEKKSLPPPQLSIASWSVAAVCTHLLYNIATGKKFKKFPEFYLSTIIDNDD